MYELVLVNVRVYIVVSACICMSVRYGQLLAFRSVVLCVFVHMCVCVCAHRVSQRVCVSVFV